MPGIFESAGYAAMDKMYEITRPENPNAETGARNSRFDYIIPQKTYDGKPAKVNDVLEDISYKVERLAERYSAANRLVSQTVKEKPDMKLYETLMYNPCLN